jgi:putative flippase GtrA
MKKRKELVLYVIFGALTTIVDWVVYSVCVKFFGFGITLSNSAACIIAIAFAFITNKLFVFESKSLRFKIVFKEAVAFVLSRFLTGLIQIFAPLGFIKLGLSHSFFGIDGFVAKLISTVIVILLNYILSKLVAFAKTKDSNPS